MNKELSTVTKPINKRKMIVLELSVANWEKFNALHAAYSEKVPGITHDMIVSMVMIKMLDEQPPSSSVDAERRRLEDGNAS